MVPFLSEPGLIIAVRLYLPGGVFSRLVQANADVTTDAGSEVDLSLEIELDTDQEGGLGVLALIVDGAAQELAC